MEISPISIVKALTNDLKPESTCGNSKELLHSAPPLFRL